MQQYPCARTGDLVVKELDEEIVVYDLNRDKAFCLNRTSALIWKACDGNTSPAVMAHKLQTADAAINEDMVQFALRELSKDGLLTGATVENAGLTRKDLIRKSGLAAALIPAVAVLAAPTALKAASQPQTGPIPS